MYVLDIQKVIEKFHIYVDKAPKRPHGVGEGKAYFFYAYYRSQVRAKSRENGFRFVILSLTGNEVRKMQFGKKDTLIDLHYEDMSNQELFLKIRDDLLHSRTGIKLEEQLAGLIKEMNSYISRMYRISEEKIKRFDAYIENYIFAFHVLTELMRARDISDIKVLAWDNVRIKQLGKRKGTGIKFWSPEDFRGSVEMFAVKNGINLGNVNAIQNFTDTSVYIERR